MKALALAIVVAAGLSTVSCETLTDLGVSAKPGFYVPAGPERPEAEFGVLLKRDPKDHAEVEPAPAK